MSLSVLAQRGFARVAPASKIILPRQGAVTSASKATLLRRGAVVSAPRRSFATFRNPLSRVDPDNAVYGLLGLNGAVFVMWQTSQTHEKKRFMVENFTTSFMHLKAGHFHSLVTSAFSQMSMSHFAMNALGLYFFGRPVAQMLGAPQFVGLYLGSAVVASLCQIAYDTYERRNSIMLGASGAVNAITSFYISAFPHSTIYIMAIVPVPAYVAGGLFIARDLWGASNGGSSVGNVAHLGGAAVGFLAFRRFATLRRYF
ncbi:serine protease family S54 [Achlya hypogyna]|uniref:Serine protease family S54 n=1 Tax=Achlya hypogyna TaxID=1202772 RepID=A0A1V9YDX8_ACHHY|nr:serine protease family S54 [Achlya hypogyna]